MTFLLYTFRLEFYRKTFVLLVEPDWFLIKMTVLAHALLILIHLPIKMVESLAEFARVNLDLALLMENASKESHLHQLPLLSQPFQARL